VSCFLRGLRAKSFFWRSRACAGPPPCVGRARRGRKRGRSRCRTSGALKKRVPRRAALRALLQVARKCCRGVAQCSARRQRGCVVWFLATATSSCCFDTTSLCGSSRKNLTRTVATVSRIHKLFFWRKFLNFTSHACEVMLLMKNLHFFFH